MILQVNIEQVFFTWGNMSKQPVTHEDFTYNVLYCTVVFILQYCKSTLTYIIFTASNVNYLCL